jgi:hypothetical protein
MVNFGPDRALARRPSEEYSGILSEAGLAFAQREGIGRKTSSS